MSKYSNCIHELVPEYTEWGDWCPTPQAYFRGVASMPGANYHVGFQAIAGPTFMEEPHCHHGVEEYLVMIGANLENIWDFDAEIDIMLGEDSDNMQQFTIDKPIIIRIPPNLWHCPINFRVINKPILWQAVYQNGTWGKTLARKRPDGTKYFEFMGDGIQICRKNPEAKCSYCGRCFKMPPPDEKAA